jgi:hypothetical protein
MWLVVLRNVKWAILEGILGSRQVTPDVGVHGTTLRSSLDPNETVIRADRVCSGSLGPVSGLAWPAGVRLRSRGGRPSGDDSLRPSAARFGRIDRSTFVPCSRLDVILYTCNPLDCERKGKLLHLRTGYFTVLMCAKETAVCFTPPWRPPGRYRAVQARPTRSGVGSSAPLPSLRT